MKAFILPAFCLLLLGCATVPTVMKGSPNFLSVGSVEGKLRGNDYYMAVGNVNLYRRRVFGGAAATGRSVESPAALQVDGATGRVRQIVTLQEVAEQTTTTSTTLNTVTTVVQNDRRYVLGELIGGISVIDIQPYPSWLAALEALRKAADTLGASGNFRVSTRATVTTTVLPPPYFGWFRHRPPHYHGGYYPNRQLPPPGSGGAGSAVIRR